MKVIELKTKKNNVYSGKPSIFYFYTDEEADKFLYVFKNHWCHVEFEKSETNISESEYKKWKEYMDKDPVKRAENNLSWGFNFARDHNDDRLTAAEESFVHKLMEIGRK